MTRSCRWTGTISARVGSRDDRNGMMSNDVMQKRNENGREMSTTPVEVPCPCNLTRRKDATFDIGSAGA